jgi:hypothetical protein
MRVVIDSLLLMIITGHVFGPDIPVHELLTLFAMKFGGKERLSWPAGVPHTFENAKLPPFYAGAENHPAQVIDVSLFIPYPRDFAGFPHLTTGRYWPLSR